MSTHVIVLGGGYAGVMAANRLHRGRGLTVTVVNPRPVFVDRIRLHEHATGTHDATRDLAGLLHRDVELVVGTADHVDVAGRTVHLADGRRLAWDHLVYAVGSGAVSLPVPGVAEHAHVLVDLEAADALRDRLHELTPQAPAVVVGGGPTGIEMAAELAHHGRPVTLVAGGGLSAYLHDRGRDAVGRRLAALGVDVVDARVTDVGPDSVGLADGRRVPSAATVWTGGFGVPDLAARSGLRTDAHGRLLTDETLTSVDDERIVAAGDAADPSGRPMRMSCQAAVPLGAQAAETVLRRVAGRPPRPVDNAFVGMCLSLGRDTGVFQVARPDDTARGLVVTGRAGSWLKSAVCRSIPAALRWEARVPGLYRWSRDRGRATRVAPPASAATTTEESPA